MTSTVSGRTGTAQDRWAALKLHARVEHVLFLSSFAVLAVTGLPQKFDSLGVSRWLMDAAGGIETLRLIHRAAGGAMIFVGVHHVALVLYAVLGLRATAPLRMIPHAGDWRDARRTLLYFLGLKPQAPDSGEQSYFQKFDYWVLLWCLALMSVSGVILLFPVRTSRLVSGDLVSAASRAHADIALLVTAWAVVVHVLYALVAPSLFAPQAAFLGEGGAPAAPAAPVGGGDSPQRHAESDSAVSRREQS
ncbi:MAG TPA: cytochrome b/b6 domain-containing protein [Dehalococcoidia bacterium]|nr:cytochrome b/b6 domain-containing protein [Dehalococcoidia bacterium]